MSRENRLIRQNQGTLGSVFIQCPIFHDQLSRPVNKVTQTLGANMGLPRPRTGERPLALQSNSLKWFSDVEHVHDIDQLKCCLTLEVNELDKTGRLKKTWWDCVKDDMENPDCPKRMCSLWMNGGELRGQLVNPGSSRKMTVKTVCTCVYGQFSVPIKARPWVGTVSTNDGYSHR